ncbi:transposase, partial [Burkholderia ambifaria]
EEIGLLSAQNIGVREIARRIGRSPSTISRELTRNAATRGGHLECGRWLLLRNRHNLKPEQAVKLRELLAANQALLCVYVLRDELKRLWFYRKPAWADKAWGQWFEQAQQSGIAALQKFAERLQGYWHGIVTRCRHPLNTSVVEGINNTIKVIKRRAYGYRDEEHFFLKIRAAFPGIPR